MKRVCLMLGALLCASAVSSVHAADGLNQDRVRIFAIRSLEGKTFKNCSATFFRLPDESCHLVTAAHCVAGPQATVQVALNPSSESGVGNQAALIQSIRSTSVFSSHTAAPVRSARLQVSRYAPELDLAELKWGAEFQDLCNSMMPLLPAAKSDLSSKRVISYRARGYVGGRPASRYSQNVDWDAGAWGSSETKHLFVSEVLMTVEINDLYVTPGMSGGLVDNNWGEAEGIISQLVPFQMRVYVIPMAAIRTWIEKGSASQALQQQAALPTTFRNGSVVAYHWTENNQRHSGGSNSHSDGGSNSHSDGGSNSHSDGGSNSHGDGDDTWIQKMRDLRFRGQSPLAAFREPEEGIVDPKNPERRLLAFDGEQIDGRDDFQMKPRILMNIKPDKNRITRGAGEALDPRIRREILNRLDGYYNNLAVHWSRDGMVSTYRNLFLRNDEVPEGWDWMLFGKPLMTIDLDAKKKTLLLDISTHPLQKDIRTMQMPAEKILFKIEPSKDFSKIELVAGELRLECDNRYYLKLICIAPSFELSLSMTYSRDRQIAYRLARTVLVEGKEWVDYQFGRIGGVQEKSQWRE